MILTILAALSGAAFFVTRWGYKAALSASSQFCFTGLAGILMDFG